MGSLGVDLNLAFTGGFGEYYKDTFLRYLAMTRDPCGVIIAGDESKSLRQSVGNSFLLFFLAHIII